MKTSHRGRGWLSRIGLALLSGSLLGLLAACGGGEEAAAPAATATATPAAVASPAATAAPSPAATAAATPAPTPTPLKLLKTEPEQVPVGGSFTMTGEGLPPGKSVEFLWATVDGSFATAVKAGSIEFHKPAFKEKRVSLGRATTDAQGRVTATFTVPEDYGEIHDIYLVADGQDVAKGGIRVPRVVTISPTSGPVGTPITIAVKGLGWAKFDQTMGVRWDNKYTGFITAITTKGTVVAQIRAAGPPGQHVIDVGDASAATPYLNAQQTPRRYKLPQFRFTFTVTEDKGSPPLTVDWPDGTRVATVSTTPLTATGGVLAAPGTSATLSPSAGPILSKPALRATGLPPDASVKFIWMTVAGNDLAGWNASEQSLGQATVGKDGSLNTAVEIPDGLGGWHTLRLVQGEKALAEVNYYVERSLVGVSPARVKVGEPFKVQVKGIGWTELDNGVAITYDNNYVGYACGFGSGGDVTFELIATGGPGTHLIDLYPMIYNRGNMQWTWDYGVPDLTFAQDHPSLALGYRLPAFRLAVEVVE